ncbi:MAG TPA: ParB/RepB/Spo0J family partition protein [Firmicutes bacterium]|nr:ParB/RepB/Spo0J family partition protein [Bacillota bacterium]
MRRGFTQIIGLRKGKGEGGGDVVRELPVDSIVANPYQPRVRFSEEDLRELSQSILEHGVIQPVLVKRLENTDDKYELIVGERRLRACKLAGLKTIPAIIKDIAPQEAAEICLIENLQRRDLDFLEEAAGYQRLMAEFGMTQQDLAKRLGKGQSTIANKLRLLKLPPRVIESISREIITERHARALLRLDSEKDQLEVLDRVLKDGLTVAETERLIERRLERLAAAGESRGSAEGRVVIRALKDVRLFLNSIRDVVKQLKATGVRASVEEEDLEEWFEVRIRISKKSLSAPAARAARGTKSGARARMAAGPGAGPQEAESKGGVEGNG